MRPLHDNSPGAHAVRVTCLHCGRMRTMSDMLIDLDGPSFRAYYCPAHFPAPLATPLVGERVLFSGRRIPFVLLRDAAGNLLLAGKA